MKRLTISLDDDLHAMVRAHAVANDLSLSKAIGDLLRRRLAIPDASSPRLEEEAGPSSHTHPISGFPVSEGDGRTITGDDVRRAEEDDDPGHGEFGSSVVIECAQNR